MTFPSTPAAGYLSPWDQQRKLSVQSICNEMIPGFACMYINPTSGGWFQSTVAERGKLVYLVDKPDARCEQLQDPALLICNGPTPIPPYRNGWGTQDWPAQVLHDGQTDGLPNSSPAGPVADSWFVWSGYGAFTCISHDATKAIWRPPNAKWLADGIHTVLVAPNQTPGTRYEGGIGGGIVNYATPFPIPTRSVRSAMRIFGAPGAAGGATTGAADTTTTLEFLQAGTYWLAVTATLSSPDADEGDMLKLTVYTRRPTESNFSPRYLSGYRLQCIDEEVAYGGATTFYTAENVSFQGPWEAEKGEQIQLVNESLHQMAAGGLILSAFVIGPNLSYTGDNTG